MNDDHWPARKVGDPDTPTFVYRRFHFKAGVSIPGHLHSIDHPTIVALGQVLVDVEGEPSRIIDAEVDGHFIAPKGKKHQITALTEAIWLCVFQTPPGYEKDCEAFWDSAG